MNEQTIVYIAEIVWKHGDRVIVGVYDDYKAGLDATIEYYESVRGKAKATRHPDWTHGLYNTPMYELEFEQSFPADANGKAYTVTGYGFVSGTPLNQTFSGVVIPVAGNN